MVLLMALVGCASSPTHRAHPELLQRMAGIRTVGLLPPVISMYELQSSKLVPHEEWSSAAVEAVTKAIAAEMTSSGLRLVMITADDPELKEMDALYNAVGFSIQRHAWGRDPFPEKVRTFDYSVGPLQGVMDRYNIDAIWIVRGINLLPTPGARMMEGLEIAVGILGSLGRVYVPIYITKKLELSVAMVDRSGNVLYYGMVDDNKTGQAAKERPGEAAPAKGELDPARPEGQEYLEDDLRDPRVARHYIRAALSGYRGKAVP